MIGLGRALPHAGFSVLQACKTIMPSTSKLNDPRKTLAGFIGDRTTMPTMRHDQTQDGQRRPPKKVLGREGAPEFPGAKTSREMSS